ncbi:MAG TPA: hypothetical protein VJL32_01615 [Candidatus Paceibacterota bacterium]
MREVRGLVCVTNFGLTGQYPTATILFGRGEPFESIGLNGLLPFRHNGEAHQAARAIRERFGNELTGTAIHRLGLRIADAPDELALLRNSTSLVVIVRGDYETDALFGRYVPWAGTAMCGSWFKKNGGLPFRSMAEAELARDEILRQHGGPARIAHLVLQSTRPNYK